ncbi:hypothetical protein RRG08_027510 [Elysia crispata]|uniref:Uncharacterized protein n=1 Tax=Elysia crispata TaxID=231223 RepID=A0AAE1D381_9GAST|nr:hypothetical protein RRG08_027510 [Elysia crispata]
MVRGQCSQSHWAAGCKALVLVAPRYMSNDFLPHLHASSQGIGGVISTTSLSRVWGVLGCALLFRSCEMRSAYKLIHILCD